MDATYPTDAMKAGSTLRFRVEDPIRGLASSTWSIVGSKKTGDLYFSAREIMGSLKISAHESGITRMAWTSAESASRVSPGEDRVLSRWGAGQDLGGEWLHVLRLSVPDSALSQILPPLHGSVKHTVVLPSAGPGHTVDVRVFVGRPGCGDLRVEGDFEEVGRMALGDGSRVWTTAWKHTTTAELEQHVAEVRAGALADGARERPVPRAFAWGWENGTNVAFVLDAGDPRPQEEWPHVIPRYDGPSNVEVQSMRPDSEQS